MKGLFITGHHTGIGKTTIAKLLVQFLCSNRVVKVRKPVETGCLVQGDNLLPQDATVLANSAANNEPLSWVCPYRFAQLSSAELASQLSQKTLELDQLVKACWYNIKKSDFVIIEGAGGLCSPIADNALNIDLAKRLNLAIIIVIKDELGAVNQALLSIKTAQQYQLKIALVVLNQFDKTTQHLNNKSVIEKYSKIPVCVYQGDDVVFTSYLHRFVASLTKI